MPTLTVYVPHHLPAKRVSRPSLGADHGNILESLAKASSFSQMVDAVVDGDAAPDLAIEHWEGAGDLRVRQVLGNYIGVTICWDVKAGTTLWEHALKLYDELPDNPPARPWVIINLPAQFSKKTAAAGVESVMPYVAALMERSSQPAF